MDWVRIISALIGGAYLLFWFNIARTFLRKRKAFNEVEFECFQPDIGEHVWYTYAELIKRSLHEIIPPIERGKKFGSIRILQYKYQGTAYIQIGYESILAFNNELRKNGKVFPGILVENLPMTIDELKVLKIASDNGSYGIAYSSHYLADIH